MNNQNQAVLYLRLSKEDVEKLNEGDESASITNQRLLLIDYALEHHYKIVKIYSDDDESGLYDDRPGFEEMMRDAKLGLFDTIIAKTQSRFSRNMEHVEKYMHHILPNLGIRFIGAVDGVDTFDSANKKTRQINGLVNEWYCEDLSKNIRSAFKAKMREGQFLGSSCPYGYVKDPENHNHLIIDEYAAGVVRKIFDLYLQGYSKAKIGSILSSENILIPSLYKKQVLKENYHNAHLLETTKLWSYQTIHSILNNETYIGNMVQNKVNKISYKDKKKRVLPKSQWIRVEGTHEPIIDKDTFMRAKELQKIKTKAVNNQESDNIFAGILFCGDCKHTMGRFYKRRGGHGSAGYICSTYKRMGKQFCTNHTIRNEELKEAVLASIKEQARIILTEDDIDDLSKIQKGNERELFYQKQMDMIDEQLEKFRKFKKKTYTNYLEEMISKEDYSFYTAQYEEEISKLNLQKEEIIKKMENDNELQEQYDEWAEAFRNYIDVDELTRDMVIELIQRIEVRENGELDIYYRFRNPYVAG